jgi:hypothetical protein
MVTQRRYVHAGMSDRSGGGWGWDGVAGWWLRFEVLVLGVSSVRLKLKEEYR